MTEKDLQALLQGEAPEEKELLRGLSVGQNSLTGFLAKQYLETYIPAGGSKIKMVTGHRGSGKTHFIRTLLSEAEDREYLTVSFSARKVWLHDFREVYLEILRQCGILRVLQGCANQIIREMNYRPENIGPGKTFMDYLFEQGKGDAISRQTIRSILREMFSRDPLLDNTFASCCSMLTGEILGHPTLEAASRELILGYMNGDKTVKMAQLRPLGLSPVPVTKYNARHLLRSLCRVVRLAGYQGMVIAVDDMETLLNRTASDQRISYTKLRRDDAYESIRQLIDDIDSMHHVLFLFGFDRELMDDDSLGMKSYQALWMRVQNEVISPRFNCFADIIDLDRFADETYSADILMQMATLLAENLQAAGIRTSLLTVGKAEQLKERAAFGNLGLPYLVNQAVRYSNEEEKENEEGGNDHGGI